MVQSELPKSDLTLREQRGKAIADQGNQIKKVNDHSFKVKSQSGNGVYEVKATPNGMTCTCSDAKPHQGKPFSWAARKIFPSRTLTEKAPKPAG
jgi:hypothetical protein